VGDWVLGRDQVEYLIDVLLLAVVGLLELGGVLVVPVPWLGLGVWLVDQLDLVVCWETDLKLLVCRWDVTAVHGLKLVCDGGQLCWDVLVLEMNVGLDLSGRQLEVSGHVQLLEGGAALALSDLGISKNAVLGGFLDIGVELVAFVLLLGGGVTLGDGFTNDVEGLVLGQIGSSLVSSIATGDTNEAVLHGLGESSLDQVLEGVLGILGVNLVLNLGNG